jgi:hypothetical protein
VITPRIVENIRRVLMVLSWHGLRNNYVNEFNMKTEINTKSVANNETQDDFKPGATIAVLTLLLAFIASSVYILISGYLNIA